MTNIIVKQVGGPTTYTLDILSFNSSTILVNRGMYSQTNSYTVGEVIEISDGIETLTYTIKSVQEKEYSFQYHFSCDRLSVSVKEIARNIFLDWTSPRQNITSRTSSIVTPFFMLYETSNSTPISHDTFPKITVEEPGVMYSSKPITSIILKDFTITETKTGEKNKVCSRNFLSLFNNGKISEKIKLLKRF